MTSLESKVVDDHPAAVLLFELLDQFGLDVIRPGVDVQHRFLPGAAGAENQDGGREKKNALPDRFHFFSSMSR
jgi:hypothetical protein